MKHSTSLPNEGSGSTAPSPTSPELIELARQGEAEAWRRLVYLYTPLVRRWCRRRGLRGEATEDVCQEVFRTVATKVADFTRRRPCGGFRCWLRRITEHKAGDLQRRDRRGPTAQGGSAARQRLEQVPEGGGPGAGGADSREDASERALLCRRALELVRTEFEPRTWQAAWRTAAEGQSPTDVAADLGMSVGAVYTAKSKVLARLRAELDALG
jgi:RNA polymerase sigma-70 factor (ECF subfamily)